ncbi:MAG TPA: hypothetical protein VKA95_07895 [Nitrososphaeraceae archaeon]|nr:hypothetical protein [Nitrososphaeraceae archaeon]
MSNVNEVIEKFEELEKAIKTHLEKVDPRLIVDLIFRMRRKKESYIYCRSFHKTKPKNR